MPQNLKALTSIRFLAAMWVVLFDYWPKLTHAPPPAFVAHGFLGVELFFVLSGFILSHVYLEGFGGGQFSYGGFLWARLARVYPLHLATLIGVGLLGALALVMGADTSHQVLAWNALLPNLLLVHAWGLAPSAGWNHPSWSISAEWFAYLCFPLVAWGAWRLRTRPASALVGVAVLVAAIYPAFTAATGEPLTRATIAWGALRIVPCFLLGAAMHLAWRAKAVRTTLAAILLAIAGVAVVVAGAALGAAEAVFVMAFGVLILALAGFALTGVRALDHPIGVYLGEVSYAVYMVCIPWMLICVKGAERFGLMPDGLLPWPLWAGMFGGVVVAAIAAHHLVERPAREAMRRWRFVKPIGGAVGEKARA
jgi:peptidoglycan/LPS O-acetylase OafA/YrhL